MNLQSLTPVPLYFLEHLSKRSDGRAIKLSDGVLTINSDVLYCLTFTTVRNNQSRMLTGVALILPLPHKHSFRFNARNLLHRSGKGKPITGQFEETLLGRSNPVGN